MTSGDLISKMVALASTSQDIIKLSSMARLLDAVLEVHQALEKRDDGVYIYILLILP